MTIKNITPEFSESDKSRLRSYYNQFEWCKCTVEKHSYYHDDGECGDSEKHHWHCQDCKGITQIG